MEALETLASMWTAEHPEYHADLSDADAAIARVYPAGSDQPRGIRQAVELLARRRGSLHDAHHEAMDCLGKMLWESQRAGRPPDGDAYVACVQRRATQD